MSTETTELADNSFNNIDILGSWVEVGMVIGAVLVGFIIILPSIKYLLRKKKSTHPCSSKFRGVHSRVHEFLTELRVKLSADRAVIIQFHNGGSFLDGSSMKKFSSTHESCSVGVSETANMRSGLLASNYIDMLEHLSLNTPDIYATSSISDSQFRRHLESNHTLVYSLMPIKDARGVSVMGCLLIEWCNWDKADLIDEDKVSVTVPEYTRYISGQLHTGGK